MQTFLFFKSIQYFSQSKASVILVRDLPPIGFMGEIVQVSPGHASNELIPNKQAVYNINGLRERLFPNFSEEETQKKKHLFRQQTSFTNKTKNLLLEFTQVASFSNPNLIKQIVTLKDIMQEVQSKYQLNIPLDIIQSNYGQELNQFGTYKFQINNFVHPVLNNKFSFELTVQLKKPVVKQIVNKSQSVNNKGKQTNASTQTEDKQTGEQQKPAQEEKNNDTQSLEKDKSQNQNQNSINNDQTNEAQPVSPDSQQENIVDKNQSNKKDEVNKLKDDNQSQNQQINKKESQVQRSKSATPSSSIPNSAQINSSSNKIESNSSSTPSTTPLSDQTKEGKNQNQVN